MTMTSETLRKVGLDALQRELGAAGAARFLQQFTMGQGDYTADRWAWLPSEAEVEPLIAQIQQMLPMESGGDKS
jgi:hypothetical protein